MTIDELRAAYLELMMRSARCFGVYDSGEAKRDWLAGAPLTGVPHLLQNLDPTGRSAPHEAHMRPRRVPHSRQKLEPVGLSR